MSRVTRSVDPPAGAAYADAQHGICPFCGAKLVAGQQPCPNCLMHDTPGTRQATIARVGPWQVLDARNPSAPGMKFETLLAQARKGQVTAKSIVRGPTTEQLWRPAVKVRGLSREFGVCYACNGRIEKTATKCPHCERVQEPPLDPDMLLEHRDHRAPRPIVHREVKPAETKAAKASHAEAKPREAKPERERELRPIGVPDVKQLRREEPAATKPVETAPVQAEVPPARAEAAPARAEAPQAKESEGPASIKTSPAKVEAPSKAAEPVPAAVKAPPKPAGASSPRIETAANAANRPGGGATKTGDRAASGPAGAAPPPPPKRPLRKPPRTGPEREDGILSARELATAFQLEYDPPSERRWLRRAAKAAVVLLVLGGIGGAGYYFLGDAQTRGRVVAWTGETWDAATERFAVWRSGGEDDQDLLGDRFDVNEPLSSRFGHPEPVVEEPVVEEPAVEETRPQREAVTSPVPAPTAPRHARDDRMAEAPATIEEDPPIARRDPSPVDIEQHDEGESLAPQPVDEPVARDPEPGPAPAPRVVAVQPMPGQPARGDRFAVEAETEAPPRREEVLLEDPIASEPAGEERRMVHIQPPAVETAPVVEPEHGPEIEQAQAEPEPVLEQPEQRAVAPEVVIAQAPPTAEERIVQVPQPARPAEPIEPAQPEPAVESELEQARIDPEPARERPARQPDAGRATAAAEREPEVEEIEPIVYEDLPHAKIIAAELRLKAMDAEYERDYDEAARIYERIMTLPREVRPADIETRLRAARRQIEHARHLRDRRR